MDRKIRENQVKTKKASSKKNQLVKRAKAITAEIKVLMGPMSRTLRSVLRQLDIELTLYWSGQFVGPQISKLLEQNRYTIVLEKLQQTFNKISPSLSETQIDKAECFLVQLGIVMGSVFRLLKLVKVTKKMNDADILTLFNMNSNHFLRTIEL